MRPRQTSKKLKSTVESIEASANVTTTIIKVPVKYAKCEDGERFIPKGLIVNEDGEVVNDNTALGVVKIDKHIPDGLISDSIGCPVIIRGIVLQHLIPTVPSKEVKEGMKSIVFDKFMDRRG